MSAEAMKSIVLLLVVGCLGVAKADYPPEASIVNCPEGESVNLGYIQAGTSATCLCNLTDVGDPPGRAEWRDSDNRVVGQGSVLTFSPKIARGVAGGLYTCRGRSSFGTGNVTAYTSKIAFGPIFAAMDIQGPNPFDMTSSDSWFIVECRIDHPCVYPEPDFRLEGDADIVSLGAAHDANIGRGGYWYRWRFEVIPRRGGTLTLKCVIINSIFPGITKEATGTKTIRKHFPAASIVNCPNGEGVKDGYVKAGTNATCECQLTVPGNPSGTPQWSGLTGRDSAQGGILTINPAGKEDVKEQYNCLGKSTLGNGRAVSYVPKVAYGPYNITPGGGYPPTFPMCNANASFTVYCDIGLKGVNPKTPNCTLEGDADVTFTGKLDMFPDVDTFSYSVTPRRGGNLPMKCVASNSLFPELTKELVKTTFVQTPPPSPPVMAVNGINITHGGHVNLTNGDRLEVTCSVFGGYPEVNQVSTSCAGISIINNGGSETILAFNASLMMDREKCECTARHITGCYHEKTEFTLNVERNGNEMGEMKDDGLSDLVVVGISAAACLFICIVVAIVSFCVGMRCQRKKKSKRDYLDEKSVMFEKKSGSLRNAYNDPGYDEPVSSSGQHKKASMTVANKKADYYTEASSEPAANRPVNKSAYYTEASSERAASGNAGKKKKKSKHDYQDQQSVRFENNSASPSNPGTDPRYVDHSTMSGRHKNAMMPVANRPANKADYYTEASSEPAASGNADPGDVNVHVNDGFYSGAYDDGTDAYDDGTDAGGIYGNDGVEEGPPADVAPDPPTGGWDRQGAFDNQQDAIYNNEVEEEPPDYMNYWDTQ